MSLLLSREMSFYLNRLRQLHLRLRDHLYRHMRAQNPAVLAQVSHDTGGDTQYAIDTHLETLLIDLCREWVFQQALDARDSVGRRGFILAPGCSVPTDISPEVLLTIREFALGA